MKNDIKTSAKKQCRGIYIYTFWI